MATFFHAQAVKSLNNSSAGRRFVFKSLSQRIEEIEIDVYRSLDKIKSQPSEGSSFFRDCLVEWRELNTAEDFISFYEKLMPLVQTLPLVLLHKELIFSELLSRLQMKARLSLEPILRLIAALSRDLLEDFIPFLPRIADSFAFLLESGADREPEIIEQIFTSWSYILMYLQRYLVKDVVHVLKVTAKLRYYRKGYVQEFMAMSTSFLLRNAPNEELKTGIRKIMFEVVKKPFVERKSGASSLLYHVMRGTSSRFHSRAERVLQLLTGTSIFTIGDKFDQGVDTVIEIVTASFQRLCGDIESKELNLMWNCVYEKIDKAVNSDYHHLSFLLSLLIPAVQVHDGTKVSDYQPMIELVSLIIQKFLVPSSTMVAEENSEIVVKVLQLMLCILDGLKSFNDESAITHCSIQWAPVFSLRNSSCLTFIRELLQKDPCIFYAFRVNILSAMNDLIETSQEEVVCLLLSFCKRLQGDPLGLSFLDGKSEEGLSRICEFIKGTVCSWIGMISNITLDKSCAVIAMDKLALLWGIICCYPHMMDIQEKPSSLVDLIDALDSCLMIEDESIAGVSKHFWQSLLGAALSSYYKYAKESGLEETSKILRLAKTYKSSLHVLSAVADYLDSLHGPSLEADNQYKLYHPEFERKKAVDALGIFADNLSNSDKGIRVSTLKILCHYQCQDCEICAEDLPPEKRMKTEVPRRSSADIHSIDVLQLLLSIETTPLSIATSRKVILLISRIQMGLSAGRISKTYIPIALSGIIGIFYNRFSYLWNPASECLSILIEGNATLVWDKFVRYFEKCLSVFQPSHDKFDGKRTELPYKYNELIEHFNSFAVPAFDSTPHATVLSALLQTLQKIPSVAESHSRQIVPLFLKFLGYDNDNLLSVGSFNSDACKGKEWRGVLKEWLNLFRLMRNPKAFYRSQFLKDVLLIRLMDENDAETQIRVLDCLLTWKDDFLLPYEQNLRKLISSKHLREELTTWSLSRESLLIEESHRANLLPLIILILIPKIRKPKTLASRKHTSAHHRKAVLRFIAEIDVNEISFLFALLIRPLRVVTKEANATVDIFWTLPENCTVELQPLNILKHFTVENIMALSWKKRYGFLHVIEDIFGVFDESHVKPFLDLLMGCVVRVLGSCTSSLDAAKDAGSSVSESDSTVNIELNMHDSVAVNNALTCKALKQLKDLRSFCLKIVSLVLNKFDDHDFGGDFWDMFFASVKSLVDSFKQEGSSSEKPSSLFSCFLAMSSSHRLVPLLSREKNLVPDIFAILTVTTASEAIRFCVLKFIENLLNIDEELDEDNTVKNILLPNLDELINSLHSLFLGNRAMMRKLANYPEETLIRMFKLLSKYIQDQSQSRKFLDVMLPMLAKRSKESGVSVDCFQIIREIIPVLGNKSTTKIVNAISPLLIFFELDMRLNICDLLDALAKTDPSVLFVAKLLHELNATSAMEMGGLDYDTILNAYEKIDVGLFYSLQEDHALLVLSHCVYDMSSEELILRHSAYRSLLSFVEFSASVLGGEVKSGTNVITVDSKFSWTKTCVQRIINKFLLKHMGNAMKEGSSVRKEWIELLRDMALKLPEMENLNSLKVLCSADAEQDFFNNIIHLQKHRRAKALSRFTNIISKSNMSEGIMNKVFVPLFFKMLLDVQGGKGEHIISACIEALASIASQMEWKSYYALLIKCFHEMKMNMVKQKALLRLICSMLDHLHFAKKCSNQGERDSLDSFGTDISETGSLPTLHKCGNNSVLAAEVPACLHKIVLPMMQKLLDSDSDKVNVNVNVAVLKVLKLLPGDIMDSQLPSIIHHIANHLKNRKESIRDEARVALAACLKELGLEYLQFVIGVLRATLKRGYELHVLGYTLHFILSKFLSYPIHGKLDYCLDDLLSVVENDILGDVAEEKEVEKIASKMKETRKLKSFDTLKIIAHNITFKSHSLKLLSPIKAYMQKHLTPKVKTKLERMLNHIAAGIECNPTVDQTDLFIFIYGFIEDGINEENNQGDNSSGKELIPHSRHDAHKTVSLAQVVGTKSGCSHLITVFALGLFHNRMKSVKLDKNNEELLSMLDPFVKLFGNCLSSRYEDILSSSLRCLTPLLRLPLPSLASQADKIKVTLLDIAQSSVNANNSLLQSCLKMLTVLLRSTKITLSSDQLHLLIQFPLFVDIESNPSFIALSLLKAVVSRKLVVPEIYDVMIRIAELMVRSQVDSIRKKCSQISLQFLLDYHLSGKYLEQYLDFLLKNLSYEYSTGREAVLEMLHAIIIKFPRNFLDKHAQTIFIHLVRCLVNDRDSKVRAMTGTVIKLLTGRVRRHLLDSMLDFSLSWYVDEKRQLQSTGAQAMGLLVEVMTKSFQKHISSILPVSKTILQAAVHVIADSPSLGHSDEAVPLWKEAYYSLVLLEKILHHFQDLSFKKDLEDIWEAVSELLIHPHSWLRNISSRLVAFYFVTATEASKENHERLLGNLLLMRPHRLFMIAASLCCQVKTQVIDAAAENLITQNLVFTVCAIHSLMGKVECPDPHVFWSGLEPHEQGLFLKAFRLLESSKGKGVFLNVISDVRDQGDGDQPENLRYLLVSNLIKKMGKIALQMEAIQMKIIFNCFGKITMQINQDELQRFAFDMVLPLYKVCEGFAGKVIPDDLKQLAQEVCETLRNILGIQNFVQVYSEVRKSIKMKRDKRKKEEKVMAVVNPMRNAKRKLRIAAKHRTHKRRKIMTTKMGRWMH